MQSFGLFLIINSLVELFNCFFLGQTYSFQFEYINFIILILIAISLLFLQSATEEIILRGYLIQAFSSLKLISPMAALLISSLIFTGLHLSNPEFSEYGILQMLVAYFIIAIFLGALAILGNGLEIPIGIHAANNFYAAVIVNYKSSALKTESLFTLDEINIPLSLAEYILILLFLIVVFYKMNWIAHPKTLIKLI